MEYVPGGSIASLVHKFGRFEEPLVRVYTRQLLQGLEYLHRNRRAAAAARQRAAAAHPRHPRTACQDCAP